MFHTSVLLVLSLLLAVTARPTPGTYQDDDEIERVGPGVSDPIEISRVQPIYPEEARLARISGKVVLEAIITKAGTVADVKVLRSVDYRLDIAAMDAVREWLYQPARKRGKPVTVYLTVTVTFKLAPSFTPTPLTSVVGSWYNNSSSTWMIFLESGLAFQCRVLPSKEVLRSIGFHHHDGVEWRQHWAPAPIVVSGSTLLLGPPETGVLFGRVAPGLPSGCRAPF